MTSFLLLPHKFFKGTLRNPKAVLAKSRSVVICLCFRILFGRSFRNQIDSLGKQTLLTLSLPEWMMEFVRWFLLLRLWTKSCGATIQMKSLWKYFHVVLFVLKNFTKWNLGVLSNLPLVIFGSERVKMTTTGPQDVHCVYFYQYMIITNINNSNNKLYLHPYNRILQCCKSYYN